MTAYFSSSIKHERLLETSQRSGWVYTKVGENSKLQPQELRLSNFVGNFSGFGVQFIEVKKFVRQKKGFLRDFRE